MATELKLKLKLKSSAALMAAIAAAFPITVYAVGAAQVDFTIGEVKALRPDGKSRLLSKGGEVASGETIDTGNGRAQVRFTDGSKVSLQPQTQFRIDNYQFNGQQDGTEKGFFNLLKGGLRTISGLVGKNNKQNYQVATSVATIGIRGTEYSITTGDGVTVSTGAGMVEVCNSGGCLILESGQSAVVPDANTKPKFSGRKSEPGLITFKEDPKFVIGDQRDSNGDSIATGPRPEQEPKPEAPLPDLTLQSGPNYAMAFAGMKGSGGNFNSYITPHPDGTANFDTAFALNNYNDANGTYAAVTVAEASSASTTDSVIGWGRWTDGTVVISSTTYNLIDAHYIVGTPTPDADFSTLANKIGTYALIGYTLPTSSTNYSGTVGTGGITGDFQANFSTGQAKLNLNGINAGGYTYAINSGWQSGAFATSGAGRAQFSFGGNVTGGAGTNAITANINGYFIGRNATYAGLVYQFSDYSNTINGAATFKQTGLTPYP